MDITNETQTREITISGFQFKVPAPYAEGHPLSANEAAVINQTLAENLRNNFAAKVKGAVKSSDEEGIELDIDALQSQLDEYVAGYEFGVRGGGGGITLDPRTREAMKMARQTVRNAIKKQGVKVSEIDKSKIDELAANLIEQNPAFYEEADRLLEAQRVAASSSIDLGGLLEGVEAVELEEPTEEGFDDTEEDESFEEEAA